MRIGKLGMDAGCDFMNWFNVCAVKMSRPQFSSQMRRRKLSSVAFLIKPLINLELNIARANIFFM